MKTKLSLIALAGLLLLVGLPGVAQAQCTDFTIVPADGRPHAVTIPFNGGGTYVRGVYFRGAPGRSYSVEAFAGVASSPNLTEIFLNGASDNSCPLANAAGVRDTRNIEPRMIEGNVPQRFSLTVTAPIVGTDDPYFVTRIRNSSTTTAQTVTVTVADTTLFSPRWSTFGGFYTSWGINNNTNASCSVTLTVKNTAGTTVASPTFAVAAGAIVFRDTRATDLNVAANQAGKVTLTHDCPPGGIQADAFMVNENVSPPAVVPVLFEPRTAGQ